MLARASSKLLDCTVLDSTLVSHGSEFGSRKSRVGTRWSEVESCRRRLQFWNPDFFVRRRYQATTSEDKEDLVFTVAICMVCRLVGML
jgi:hypothetical protein